MAKRPTMSKTGADSWHYRGWYIERGFRVYFAGKLLVDRTIEFKANSLKNARNVIDDYEATGKLNISPGGYGTSEKDPPLGQYRGQDIARGYKGWNIEKKEFHGVRGGTILAYEATKGDQIQRHEKLKTLKRIIDDIETGSNPTRPMKFDPIGGDIEEVENLIRFHKRKLEADERDAARYDPEFIEQGILNSIADHNRELKKLTAKLARLKKRKGNPMATKKKAKRKATPAQLRALKKAHAALRKKRALKKKAPKRPRRVNPAYANYSKARSVARGNTRGVNPVRKLAPMYAIQSGARYFDGVRFSSKVGNAARFATLPHCKTVAQKIADATGKACKIVDLRK